MRQSKSAALMSPSRERCLTVFICWCTFIAIFLRKGLVYGSFWIIACSCDRAWMQGSGNGSFGGSSVCTWSPLRRLSCISCNRLSVCVQTTACWKPMTGVDVSFWMRSCWQGISVSSIRGALLSRMVGLDGSCGGFVGTYLFSDNILQRLFGALFGSSGTIAGDDNIFVVIKEGISHGEVTEALSKVVPNMK